MVRFAKPHISVIYTEQWRNMMVLNNQDFIIENLTVRFTIYVFSVIFKNSAAVTNTRPGFLCHALQHLLSGTLSGPENIGNGQIWDNIPHLILIKLCY